MTAPAPPASSPKPDRFLLAILAGVGVLLVAAAVSIFILRQPGPELSADSPGGTVQRFLTAVEQGDYGNAYNYLSKQTANKPTLDALVPYWTYQRTYIARGLARIDDQSVTGAIATVTVAITQSYDSNPLFGGPFFGGSGEYTDRETFILQREDSTWRITSLPPEYGPIHNP